MAGSPYFLQIDAIPGASMEKGHEGWIPIQMFDFEREKNYTRFQFVTFQDKSTMNLLLKNQSAATILASAKLDQAYNPRAPSTLITLRKVNVVSLGPFDAGFFRFTMDAEVAEAFPGRNMDYTRTPVHP